MNTRHLMIALGLLVAVVLAGCRGAESVRPDAAATAVARLPRLTYDLEGVVIPVNLAPPPLTVREPGQAYHVVVAGAPACEAFSTNGVLQLPPAAWSAQLARHERLALIVSVQGDDGRWQRFAPLQVQRGPALDRYLVYRQIGPVYNYYTDVRIRQRDLQTGRERTLVTGTQFGGGCVNCHTFNRGKTDRMTLNVRGQTYGDHALLMQGKQVTKFAKPWGYNSWHPGGQMVAYSLNKVRQFFHDAGPEVRDVVDLDSDIVIYRLDTQTVLTSPDLADPNRLETYPSWSADGKYLYYCSAPILWADREKVPPRRYREVRYDLRRVPFDEQTGQFGKAEVLISAAAVGKSALLPRPSPDGKWLLLCLCDYGCFPIYQPSSDLYLMNLRDKSYHRLAFSSDRAEAWHSWSSDSRWIVFSSKRRDGLLTRAYLSQVGADGQVSRPLLLAVGEPATFDRQLKTVSVPELVTEPVRLSAPAIGWAVRGKRETTLKMPEISMTRKPKTAPVASDPWQQPAR